MSYGCEVSFKEVDSIKSLNEFMSFLKEKAIIHYMEIIKEYKHSLAMTVASTKYQLANFIKDVTGVSSEDKYIKEQFLIEIIHRIFTYRWIYLEESHYIAMYSIPRVLQQYFDGTVYFQNSTDRDYQREKYGGLTYFENIFDTFMKKSTKEIAMFFEINNISVDNVNYYRRWAAYQHISKPIENGLYDDKNAVYLSLFRGADNIFESEKMLKYAIDVLRLY